MKLIFNQLIVEITRRCNMACAHCMRGDAQSIDLATEHIDALLDQTKQIEYLMFTGGEPTLNIEGMRYFLDGCIKRNIKIEYLNLILMIQKKTMKKNTATSKNGGQTQNLPMVYSLNIAKSIHHIKRLLIYIVVCHGFILMNGKPI